MMRARVVGFVVLAMVVLALPISASAAQGSAPAGRFIVTLRDGVDARSVAAEYRRDGAAIDYVYTAALHGFAGAMSDGDLGRLQADGRVARIERDGIASASTTENAASWGIDRIDQRTGTDGTYTYDATGSGVTAYVIDTGILYSHTDLGGRVAFGYDAFGGNGTDCNGHGTHVSGTIGGTAYGVAKSVSLVAVRVLDCSGSGTWSGVIAGLDWVTANHATKAVANMSLGGGASASVDDAVRRTISSGVTVAVAAGNGNNAGVGQDACGYSPARVSEALTIGATSSADVKTSWSNYGSCVDFFAPGLSITSDWYTSNTATNTISGTSMATPHVAGVAALYLESATSASPATVSAALADATTKAIVTSSSTLHNDLLYSRVAAVPVQTGSLTGTVTSTSSGAVQGATVAAGGATATTDVNGVYSMTLPAGTYTVTATAAGYDTATGSATITGGSSTNLAFSLVASSTPSGSITLLLTKGPKAKNVTAVTATWTDTYTPSSLHDVWANGSWRATNVSGNSYKMSWRGSGTVTYHVCRSGTTICSPDVAITI